jgi:hypothetical protein
MNDTPQTPAQLGQDRLDEIRALARQLAGRPDPGQAPRLLAEAHTALTDVLADRDDLARANAETSAELALWTGSL